MEKPLVIQGHLSQVLSQLYWCEENHTRKASPQTSRWALGGGGGGSRHAWEHSGVLTHGRSNDIYFIHLTEGGRQNLKKPN